MKKAWLALVFGSALFLAACGGDDEDTTTPDNDANETEDVANEEVVDEGTTDENATDEGTTDEGATDEEATDEEASTDGADEATLARGEEVVNQSCTSCHGGNLEGVGSFPGIKGLTAEEVLTAIQEGPGSMPPNLLKGEDAEAAAAYLATLK